METSTLTMMILGLMAVFAVDTIQKRRTFISKNRNE